MSARGNAAGADGAKQGQTPSKQKAPREARERKPDAGGAAEQAGGGGRKEVTAEERKAAKNAKKAEKEARKAAAKAKADAQASEPKEAQKKPEKEAQPKREHQPRQKKPQGAEQAGVAAPQPVAAAPAAAPVSRPPSAAPNRPPSASPAASPHVAAQATPAPPGGILLPGPAAGPRGSFSQPKKAAAAAKVRPSVLMQYDDAKRVAKFAKQSIVQRKPVVRPVSLFAHLPQYEREKTLSLKTGFAADDVIHPAILRLGLQYASGAIVGANARCVAMLNALKEYIADYHTPPNEIVSRDLQAKLRPLIRYIIDCRPQATAMGNAIRYLKMKISKIPPQFTEQQAKEELEANINTFIQERIEAADTWIASSGAAKIRDGDVILTYARSHVVEMILKRAHDEKKQFRVVVVDSRPRLEGRELLRRLLKHGIRCTYMLINALPYVIKQVSKVFVGAAACLANGSVVSRVGTAVVCTIARTHNIPVLVCCETYKFHERVQLDSICFNEVSDPDDLVIANGKSENKDEGLSNWRSLPSLQLLNLVYDVTPADSVSMVITEVGMIPPTSVPVILREYHKETQVVAEL